MSSRQQQQQQQAEAAAALQRYGAFVDEVLKPQLQQTLARRDAITREAAEYAELRALLAELRASHASGEPLQTLMELGEQFRVRAKIRDTSMVTVDVGLNFHVEMTVQEASAFVDKHLQHLAGYGAIVSLSCSARYWALTRCWRPQAAQRVAGQGAGGFGARQPGARRHPEARSAAVGTRRGL